MKNDLDFISFVKTLVYNISSLHSKGIRKGVKEFSEAYLTLQQSHEYTQVLVDYIQRHGNMPID